MTPSIMIIFFIDYRDVKGGYNNKFKSCIGLRPILVQYYFSTLHCYVIIWFITVESSLLVGTNIRGVRVYFLLSNLHPNELRYNHLFNSYKIIQITLPLHYITIPKPGNLGYHPHE